MVHWVMDRSSSPIEESRRPGASLDHSSFLCLATPSKQYYNSSLYFFGFLKSCYSSEGIIRKANNAIRDVVFLHLSATNASASRKRRRTLYEIFFRCLVRLRRLLYKITSIWGDGGVLGVPSCRMPRKWRHTPGLTMNS